MQLLISDQEFLSTPGPQLVPLKCKRCEKIFYKKKYQVTPIYEKRKYIVGRMDYCSVSCSSTGREGVKTRKLVPCAECGKPTFKRPSDIKAYKKSFCSLSHKMKFYNSQKWWGGPRSKLEKFIEPRLKMIFPELDIHFNERSLFAGELDIYIPSLKLAFELNGLIHYKVIYGEDKFIEVQRRDKQKINDCQKLGIKLHIIRTDGQKKVNDATCLPFLLSIRKTIEDTIQSKSLFV